MTLPNLLIIGAAKSGTTSLYMYLEQHPEIFMSPVKEPHFFSYDAQSKMTKGPKDTIPTAITDIEKYKNLFINVNNKKIIGEASPTYIYREEAPERIYNLIPEVKIIAILRDPSERAFSAYMHLIRDQRETTNSFSEALELEEFRIKQGWGPIWHYKRAGLYYQQLSNYFQLFKRDQIRVILHEDLQHKREEVLKDIFNFLEIDTGFTPEISIKYNASGIPKNKILQNFYTGLFNSPNPIKRLSRIIFPMPLRLKVTTYLQTRNIKKVSLPGEERQKLIGYFREDILHLESLINRDLSNWLS
jgi:hypothetical protein